jgi:hypothetical protein
LEECLVIILYQQPALEPLAHLRCPSCMTMACLVASACRARFVYLGRSMYCTCLRLLACHEAIADRFPKSPTHIALSVLYPVSNASASLTSTVMFNPIALRRDCATRAAPPPLKRREVPQWSRVDTRLASMIPAPASGTYVVMESK